MKRSLYLAAPVPRALGGFQQHLRNVVRALDAPVDVLEYGDYRAFPKAAEFSANARPIATYESRIRFTARLARDYLTRPPTLFVIGHVSLLRSLAALPRQPRHRIVLTLAGTDAWFPLGPLERRALYLVDEANFIADYNRLWFEAKNLAFVRPSFVTTTIPVACTPEDEALPWIPLPESSERRAILISRLESGTLKGIDNAIAAVRHLDPRWSLDIVGTGDALPAHRRLAKKLGVDDRVVFHGQVTDERRRELIGKADVLTLPSAQEGFGIVFLEAMVRGRPCVGAAAGAIPEIVKHDVGELVAFGNECEIAAAIVRTSQRLRNGELSAHQVRQSYEARFSWLLFASRWKACIAPYCAAVDDRDTQVVREAVPMASLS